MVNQLIIPEWQYVDGDGVPLVGGTIDTFVPGTMTRKGTYADKDGLVANTNPVILDADGRCSMWSTGQVRCIVKDALGNLVYDEVATAALSDSAIGAVLPCLAQPTLQGFRDCSGITAAIAAAVAGVTTLVGPTGPTGPVGASVTGPTGPTGPAAAGSSFSLANPGYILLGTYGSAPLVNFGFNASDSSGRGTVTYAKAFTAFYAITTTVVAPEGVWCNPSATRNGGFDFVTMTPYAPGSTYAGPFGFGWIVVGW